VWESLTGIISVRLETGGLIYITVTPERELVSVGGGGWHLHIIYNITVKNMFTRVERELSGSWWGLKEIPNSISFFFLGDVSWSFIILGKIKNICLSLANFPSNTRCHPPCVISATPFKGGPRVPWDLRTRTEIIPVKDPHTRTKPLTLANGRGRYIAVTPETAPWIQNYFKKPVGLLGSFRYNSNSFSRWGWRAWLYKYV
jgi:hypothetical protein